MAAGRPCGLSTWKSKDGKHFPKIIGFKDTEGELLMKSRSERVVNWSITKLIQWKWRRGRGRACVRAPAPKCNAAIKIRNPRQLNYSIRAERKEKKKSNEKEKREAIIHCVTEWRGINQSTVQDGRSQKWWLWLFGFVGAVGLVGTRCLQDENIL